MRRLAALLIDGERLARRKGRRRTDQRGEIEVDAWIALTFAGAPFTAVSAPKLAMTGLQNLYGAGLLSGGQRGRV